VSQVKVAGVSIEPDADLPEGLEGVRAGDIRVKNKEWRVIFAENLSSKGKGPG